MLVAAAALEPRTLLRAQDVTWKQLTGPAVPGVILRPTEAQRRDKPLIDDETALGRLRGRIAYLGRGGRADHERPDRQAR